MKKFSMSDLKKKNCADVFRCLYEQGECTKQQIANYLKISLPTINQHLATLTEQGLIQTSGHFSSGIGRRAIVYSVDSHARLALGLEITAEHITIVALDLYGEIIDRTDAKLKFGMKERYYRNVANMLDTFVETLACSREQIIGAGLAIQGLVSLDGTQVTYGKILACTGLNIDSFAQHIPYPCRLFHDIHCSLVSELWRNTNIKNAVFLALNQHLGSALVIDGQVFNGRDGRSGTLEHMLLLGEARTCYCGQKNCAECYCSINALLHEGEDLKSFMIKKHNGELDASKRWDRFLDDLSQLIHNAQVVLDGDVILGGYLTAYLTVNDLEAIRRLVHRRTSIPQTDESIILSRNSADAIGKGAAIPYLQEFLEHTQLGD